MKQTLFLAGILIIVMSCRPYPREVEEVLALSGDNRNELERVLNHFRQKDMQEFEAACFLIANMQYHQSKEEIIPDAAYYDHFRKTDSLYEVVFSHLPISEMRFVRYGKYDSVIHAMSENFDRLPEVTKKTIIKSDLECIKADYLIDNIEQAFTVWRNLPQLRTMSFEDFKELILPYRTTDEYAEWYKRSELRELFAKRLMSADSLSTVGTLEWYKTYAEKCRRFNNYIKTKRNTGLFYDFLLRKAGWDCQNTANWTCDILRACGIPVVYEFTPKWTERDSRHFWCCSPDSSGILLPYTPPENNLCEDWQTNLQYASKVYRTTFGAQKNTPYFIADEDEYIPEPFLTPLLSDQTFRYHQTVTLRFPLQEEIPNKVVYLCMLTRGEPRPVGWGVVDERKKEIVFEQVPLNILFVPAYYDGDMMVRILEPFMIQAPKEHTAIARPLTVNKQNKVTELSVCEGVLYHTGIFGKKAEEISYMPITCDTTQRTTMRVYRKYPEKERLKVFYRQLEGAIFTASDHEKKRRYFDTLHTLDYVPHPYLQEVTLHNTRKYRYYHFSNLNRGRVYTAHMEFLGPRSSAHVCTPPTPLPIFSDTVGASVPGDTLYRIHGVPIQYRGATANAFDGDFTTYVNASIIGMDFKEPVQITHVRFVPRNANNMIVAGDSYLLMYYDGTQWKEHLPIVYAGKNYLDFTNVPVASLYLLRNLTNGKEELPFFYQNGKQYFLHVDTLETTGR